MRFQIVIAVWGDKFIDQMCEICLPCVLAPNNLPAIPCDERFRFVFVTRSVDATRLRREPIVQRIAELIPVDFLEFDPTAYKSPHLALSGAHKMALAMAVRESAHFILLDPDLIFSDNTLTSARRMALAGKSAVMVSGLRLATESAMPVLRKRQLTTTYASNPLLQPRNLMKFALEHFHPEVARYHFDAPNFTQWPLVCLWPIGNEGLLDRSFHLHPLVLNMSEAMPEALSTLDYDTIDGAFVFHAFPDWGKIHVEDDSDNGLVFSFSSIHEAIEPPQERRATPALLRETAYMFNVNPLHRSLFDHAIKLHTGDLNNRWIEVERKTASLSKHFRFPPRRSQSIRDRLRLLLGRFAPGLPMPSESWQTFQDRGIQRDADGDHRGAAEDFARAIRIGPPNPALHFLRGVALVHAGDTKAAVAEFKSGRKLDPKNTSLSELQQIYSASNPSRIAMSTHVLALLWHNRRSAGTRLAQCVDSAEARARVGWRVRYFARSVRAGRWLPEPLDAP